MEHDLLPLDLRWFGRLTVTEAGSDKRARKKRRLSPRSSSGSSTENLETHNFRPDEPNNIYDPQVESSNCKASHSNEDDNLPDKELQLISNFITRQDKEGDNILFLAIIMKRLEVANMLIDLVTDYKLLRFHNTFRQTCLHLASVIDDRDVMRRLVVAGAEVSSQDWKGNTPLHIACLHGYTLGVETLLRPVSYEETLRNRYDIPYQQIPQDMEIRNYDGQTCLIIAVSRKHTDIVTLLIGVDANINTVDMKTGKTCLHMAAEMGDISFLKFILSKPGLILDSKTYAGYTAAELAYYRNHFNAVYVLQCVGASRPRSFDLIESYDSDSD